MTTELRGDCTGAPDRRSNGGIDLIPRSRGPTLACCARDGYRAPDRATMTDPDEKSRRHDRKKRCSFYPRP